jgi:YHS domain-containing protein
MKTLLSIALASTFALASCTKEKTVTMPMSMPTMEQTHCPVSGEELGSMGDPVVVTHEGTTVKLCCEKCVPKFEKDPAKYVEEVNNAKK